MWYYSRLLSNRYQQPCHGLYTFKNTLACLKTLITLLMNTLPFFCKEQNILIFRSNCWTGISLTHILSPSECCLVYGMCASNLQCSVQHQKAHDKIQITQETERRKRTEKTQMRGEDPRKRGVTKREEEGRV